MPKSDWMLEENCDEGMLEELRQQKTQRLKEDIAEEKRHAEKCLNCDEINPWTKDNKCPHCKAELPRDRAFQNLHMNQCRGR